MLLISIGEFQTEVIFTQKPPKLCTPQSARFWFAFELLGLVLAGEARALCILGRHTATKLNLQIFLILYMLKQDSTKLPGPTLNSWYS